MGMGEIIAALALLVSIYSIYSSNENKKENKVIKEKQAELTKALLSKETKRFIDDKKADISAHLYKIGKNYRLKIYNKGKSPAQNLTLKFPNSDANEYLIISEIDSKFPYEILYPQQNIELLASVTFGTKSKYKISFQWSDDYDSLNKKDIFIDV